MLNKDKIKTKNTTKCVAKSWSGLNLKSPYLLSYDQNAFPFGQVLSPLQKKRKVLQDFSDSDTCPGHSCGLDPSGVVFSRLDWSDNQRKEGNVKKRRQFLSQFLSGNNNNNNNKGQRFLRQEDVVVQQQVLAKRREMSVRGRYKWKHPGHGRVEKRTPLRQTRRHHSLFEQFTFCRDNRQMRLRHVSAGNHLCEEASSFRKKQLPLFCLWMKQ